MPPMTRAEIAAHPLFPSIEKQIARHLIGIHLQTPRMSRLKASHRKWLMTQSLFALALRRTPDDPLSGLTATRSSKPSCGSEPRAVTRRRDIWPNWWHTNSCAMSPMCRTDALRVLEATELSLGGMRSWFNGHMACLDRLDGGRREQTSIDHEAIFILAQPLAADMLVDDPVWRDPADSIGHFLWSDLGGMVLHDLVSRLDDVDRQAARHLAGPVTLAELSEVYQVSANQSEADVQKAERTAFSL